MKTKNYILTAILGILLFVSCQNQPIFSAIEQEIYLKNFSVDGNIIGIINVGGNVYAASPANICSKGKVSDEKWSEILDAGRITGLASDGTNIFVSFQSGKVKFLDTGNTNNGWKNIPNTENIQGVFGNKTVFGYDLKNKKVYKISTSSCQEILAGSNSLISAANDYFLITGKPKTGNEAAVPPKLYKGASLQTGLPEKASKICAFDNDNLFVLAGSSLYYYTGDGTWNNKIEIKKDKVPFTISYFKERKTVLIGCIKGYTEIKLDNDNPTDLSKAKQLNPGEEGSTTPPACKAQYQSALGLYLTSPILGIDRGGSNYALFVGIHAGSIYRNTGLWGFYSDKKREWNRE